MPGRRSEIVIGAWKARYARGEAEVWEMEAAIDRALRGEVSDAEYVKLAQEERLHRASSGPPSLEGVDQLLKNVYRGPEPI